MSTDNARAVRAAQKTTIVDVAERAGVSIKTVSRVVNREPNVRESTREKVEAAIAELNYRPNPSARGLAGNRSYSIGLLYESPQEFGYVRNALNGVIEACEAEGYSLLMRPCHEQPDLAGIERFVAQTRIDGAVLTAPICDNDAVTRLLEEQGVPVALLAPQAEDAARIVAQCDDERAAHDMTEYLIGLGHRRIGFIKGHPSHGASDKRLAGYLSCLRAHGMAPQDALLCQGYFDFDSGRACAERLLRQPEPPTAIFASNDDMAAGVVFVARELGLAVPEQLSVAGFDDSPVASRTWPTLTTVKQPVVEMADEITRRLIERLRGQDGEVECAVHHCELVVRSSTAPLG